MRSGIAALLGVAFAGFGFGFGCTSIITTSLPDRPVDNEFHVYGADWGNGRSVYFAYLTEEQQGKVALCGVWAASNGNINDIRFDDLLVQSARIELDGTIIANDISFFAPAPFVEGKVPAGTARCVGTSVGWEPRFDSAEPELIFAKSRFKIYD